MSTNTSYNDLPLCISSLSDDEAIRLEAELLPLLRYLGSPGDWGYRTKLGRLTGVLHELVAEIRHAGKQAAIHATHEAPVKEQDTIPVLDVWEAIGHDIGVNPSKEELLDSLRYMAQMAEVAVGANPAWQAVIHERMRQVSVEGYHPDYDDEHTNGELLDACICYLIEVQCKSDDQDHASHVVPMEWPWAPECWKPATPRRMLEKALALGLAELERMIRAEAAAPAQGEPSHG
ncbi:hypothetical protein [Stutzerimonas stutzeri]|uniref:hypothetical protein n=1 Tax=Stutzerimonas stutzeri TaxID=316 RepID=UPI001BCA9E9B|nr:hypothetical protein [Stutzerimonas stutzeri]